MKEIITALFEGLAALFRPESTSMDDKMDKLLNVMGTAQNKHEDWIEDYREVKSMLTREAQRRWDFARQWSIYVGVALISCFLIVVACLVAVTLKHLGVF